MTTLQGLLGRALAPKRRQRTQLVTIWPDGSVFVVHRKGGAWWYRRDAGSSPLAYALDNAKAEGARVERRPIP